MDIMTLTKKQGFNGNKKHLIHFLVPYEKKFLKAALRQIKFDPKHTSLVQIEKIIKDQTGYTVKLTQDNVRVTYLKSKSDMMNHFAQKEDAA